MTTPNKHAWLLKAKFAEATNRLDEMIEAMKHVTKMSEEPLTKDERNLLLTAFKNKTSGLRDGWRLMMDYENHLDDSSDKEMAKQFRTKIEEEIKESCHEVFALVDELLPRSKDNTSRVFYIKMKADAIEKAKTNYMTAYELAQKELAPHDPVRLGLYLNFSVFYFEIEHDKVKAIEMAKTALTEATASLEALPPDEPKSREIELILSLLNDNFLMWTNESTDGYGSDEEDEHSD